MKINQQMVNHNWNDWIFHIHWNKLEWVNLRIFIEGNNPFCVSSKKFCLKDNNKNAHQVGNSKLNPLDIKDFSLKKNIINELEAS